MTNRIQGIPPQSDDEVQRIEARLRELDPQLRIRWNPRAIEIVRHEYDIPVARMEGRWEVVRIPTSDTDLVPGVVFVVRDPEGGTDEYAPLGDWLVEFMQKWDAANAQFAANMRKQWEEHDRAEESAGVLQDDSGAKEALEKVHHSAAGRYWIGRGFDSAQSPGT